MMRLISSMFIEDDYSSRLKYAMAGGGQWRLTVATDNE